jgi:uncharacterized membrane protein
MLCPQCSNEVSPQAAFCNHCGTPLAAAVPPPTSYIPVSSEVPPASAMPPIAHAVAPPASASSGLSDNAAGAIAYITIIPAILFLILEPYNRIKFVRFHSFQSIGLAAAWVIVWVTLTILHGLLHVIPLSWLLFILLDFVVAIGFFVIWLLAIIKASKGEWYKLPIIGDIALKQVQQG